MTTFRMTLRHGERGQRYHVVDFEAADIRDALMQAVNAVPPGSEASADLVEIRVLGRGLHSPGDLPPR